MCFKVAYLNIQKPTLKKKQYIMYLPHYMQSYL